MGRLVSNDFAEIISKVPDQNYDVQKVMEIFQEYLPGIAHEYGLVYVKASIVRPGREHVAMQEMQVMDMYHADFEEECREKQYDFEMGNGGHVSIFVGVQPDCKWTPDMEQDIFSLMKVNYLLMGRAQAMHDLSRAMFEDTQTGIPNQAGAYRFMGDRMADGSFTGYNLCFLNVRNMKLMNDRYREAGGNILLRKYAHALKSFAGNSGCAARLGGDNFMVFIPRERQQELLDFLQEMYVELAGHTGIPSKIKMETRVGYYEIQEGDSIQDVMRNASIAIKNARTGAYPDVVRFEAFMHTQMYQVKQLEDDVPGAIEREEFAVYYQPKAYMSGKDVFELCGAEALVRWFKDGEIVAPGVFVPLLEKNGMIAELDFYVLEHVCRDISFWKEKGLDIVPISVNFSRRHLKYEDIADRVMAVIRRYGVDPACMEIEITESYDDEDMGVLSRFEKKMHEAGIRVSVDDFGSGFSSLKMIKNIVSDIIKLDKSIVDGVGNGSRDDEIIVSHIIQMIRELGKEVIAEGVESAEQAEFLRLNGCDRIQGFLYGRPMSWEAFEKRLAER